MAGASLLALIDDIAALMDDVSVMTKVAAKKTAGVLGDDLAVNAEKVTGVAADRELPVVFAVFKGSLLNKFLLVPAALVIAAVAPWLIGPLLLCGGLFLCFEGFEKVWHHFTTTKDERRAERDALQAKLEEPGVNPLELERKRIRGAIRTDMILSAEIIVITLGIVGEETLAVKAGVLSTIALAMTFGVYGLVAAIVKVDDAGLRLAQADGEGFFSSMVRGLGRGLLALAPKLMVFLSVFGTLAMFLVGGGILVHGIPPLHHVSELVAEMIPSSDLLAVIAQQLFIAIAGLVAGAVVLMVLSVTGLGHGDKH